MRNKYKSIKYIIIALLILWIIFTCIYSTKLSRYLSSFSPFISEGEGVIDYYNQDNDVYTLKPGMVLSLPVRLEKRLSRIGISTGKQEDSSDKYVFRLEDESGSVLGQNIISLEDIMEDQFIYISSRSVISNKDNYYIKIFSDASAHTPLNLNVSLAASFQTTGFQIGGAESEYTLILDRRYEADNVKGIILIDVILSMIVILICIVSVTGERKNKRADHFVKRFIRIISWRKINLVVIALLAIASIILVFAKRTVYVAQYGNIRDRQFSESVITLDEGIVLEQYLRFEDGDANSFSLLFGTFFRKIKGGLVYVELWDDTTNELFYSASLKTEAIRDNQYSYFQMDRPVQQKHILRLRIRAEYASESGCVAVYLNSNCTSDMFALKDGEVLDQSLVFEFSKQTEMYRADIALIINAVLSIALLLYFWNYVKLKKEIFHYLLNAVFIFAFCFVPVLSYLNYHEISMNGMKSCLPGRDEWISHIYFGEEELTAQVYRETEYDFDGIPFIAYERIELPVFGGISDVTFHYKGHNMVRKDYDIQIYWNTGNGYNDAQSYTYKYVHQGQDELSFQIPCSEPVKSIMLNVGMTSDRFTGKEIADRIFPLTGMEINTFDKDVRLSTQRVILAGICVFAFSVASCLWNYFKLDKKLSVFFAGKKLSISSIFIILAAISGISMSFLIPTFQVPDEPAHISMLYTDIGNSSMANAIYDTLDYHNLTGEVMLNAGQTVDRQSYNKDSSKKLEDYSFSRNFPSIRILRRPGQAAGVLIGQLLHLPAYWILQLGELGALAIYIAMGALTLKIIPYKKNLMMIIMLLPVAMQEASSLAYDSFNNALAFLTIAYILYLKVEAEKITWKQIAALAVLAAGLLIGKVIYVLLLGLVFIIPLRKLDLKVGGAKGIRVNEDWVRRHWVQVILFIIGSLCLCAIGSFILIKNLGYGEIDKMLWALLTSFPQLVRLCISTCIVHWRIWLRGMVAALGNYDVPVNQIITWIGIVSICVFAVIHHRKTINQTFTGQKLKDSIFSGRNLIIWYGVFGVLFVTVLMTMINWGLFIYRIDESLPYSVSLKLLPRIEGVQGRYFYPILPLLLIPVHLKKDVLHFIPVGLYKICYYCLMTIYPITLLLVRYWGFLSW